VSTDQEIMSTLDREPISEADLDAALAHYLAHAAGFGERLLAHVGYPLETGTPAPVLRHAERSVRSLNGETDVVAEWRCAAGRAVVLIESKLTAGFQPEQGARYAARARTIAPGAFVRTLIIAPRAYLAAANPEVRQFDAAVSVEQVLDWMDDCTLDTGQELRRRLAEGLRRAAAGLPTGSKGLFPDLHLAISERASARRNGLAISNNGTDWIFLCFPCKLPGVEMRYRIRSGIAELAFTPAFKGDLTTVLQGVTAPLEVHSSGKNHHVRIRPGPLSPEAFSGAATDPDISAILDALEALAAWWTQEGVALAGAGVHS
jgi:hypothetical protein